MNPRESKRGTRTTGGMIFLLPWINDRESYKLSPRSSRRRRSSAPEVMPAKTERGDQPGFRAQGVKGRLEPQSGTPSLLFLIFFFFVFFFFYILFLVFFFCHYLIYTHIHIFFMFLFFSLSLFTFKKIPEIALRTLFFL